MAAAVGVHPDRAERDNKELSLDIGVDLAEGKQLLDGSRTQTTLGHLPLGLLGASGRAAEVDEDGFTRTSGTGTDRFRFTDPLAPGTYRFVVTARVKDGPKSDAVNSPRFHVLN